MKKAIPLLPSVALAVYGQSETPRQADELTIEGLSSNPEQLKDLRRQCKSDHAALLGILNQFGRGKR
ncbi:hypothetical protein FJU30_09460 [Affinibrenneria salicis]|uniref:Uncharacterized protein n=1 Tax=Affinibrenneria salicis TaxID=2590031 RepID=A0A5J5G140_9GAMM|nr:hypothetical protein [Affinibrenneria salicis]KAA9000467.1 hypothetical protein FJU30_09460 [Affinibrenneria salicis]